MPIYEYKCRSCGERYEVLRPMADRERSFPCPCGARAGFMVSVPTMQTWNQERAFPNVSPHGDGTQTFATKTEYEAHLKAHEMAESSTDAPVKRPHGNRVIYAED